MLLLGVAAACSPAPRNFGSGGGGGGPSSSSASGQGGNQASSSHSSGSGTCVDTTTATNCGVCGHDCTTLPNVTPASVTCVGGMCSIPAGGCQTNFAHCTQNPDDGCETNVTKDNANCGGCGSACLIGQLCGASKCTENQLSCVNSGTCAQAFCNDLGHYSVTPEIVVDLKTNRTLWQRHAYPKTLDYAGATSYCAGLALEGVTKGWRVPTSAELGAITYKAGGLNGCPANYCNPAIDQAAFLDTVVDEYWTSSAYMPGINYCVSFCDGRSSPWKEDVTSLHYVRCMHDPLP